MADWIFRCPYYHSKIQPTKYTYFVSVARGFPRLFHRNHTNRVMATRRNWVHIHSTQAEHDLKGCPEIHHDHYYPEEPIDGQLFRYPYCQSNNSQPTKYYDIVAVARIWSKIHHKCNTTNVAPQRKKLRFKQGLPPQPPSIIQTGGLSRNLLITLLP